MLCGHELIVAGAEESIGADGLRRRLPVDRYHCGAHIDGGGQETREHDQRGEREAEQGDHCPMLVQDPGVKRERPLGIGGIAQAKLRLMYGK